MSDYIPDNNTKYPLKEYGLDRERGVYVDEWGNEKPYKDGIGNMFSLFFMSLLGAAIFPPAIIVTVFAGIMILLYMLGGIASLFGVEKREKKD